MKHLKASLIADVMSVITLVRGNKITTPPLTMETSIVNDLHLEHDAEDIMLLLQKKTGIKPPQDEWTAARTIRDIVELLFKYA
jgi:acyl carrier protein